jgi:hypothetical protein
MMALGRLKQFRTAALEALWFLACTIALTWPVALQPAAAALGSQHADGMKHLWTLWWIRASVWRQGSFPFDTQLVNYPVGMDLYPIEPLNGLIAVLLPWVDIVLLSNLLIMVNLVLTGIAGAWFGRVLTEGRRWAGLAAGTVLLCSSVTSFFVTVGVGELTHLWWLPLGLGLLIKATRQEGWRPWVWVGLALVGAVLSCFYLGFFLGIAVLIVCLWRIASGPNRLDTFLRALLAAAIVLSITVPVSRTFARSYAKPETASGTFYEHVFVERGQQVTDVVKGRLDPTQLLAPGRKAASAHEASYGGGRYIGIGVVLLALAGVIRRPKEAVPWVVIALLGVVFALGSFLTIGGLELETGAGGRYRMPMLWLNRMLETVAEPVNFPSRFLALTVVALSALVALAVKRWTAALAVVAALEVMRWQLVAWPLPTFNLPNTSALEALADHPGRAIVDVSLTLQADAANRSLSLAGQMSHQHPTNTVPVERIEFFARDGFRATRSMTLLGDIYGLYFHESSTGLQGDYREDIGMLKDLGYDVLLIATKDGSRQIPERARYALNKRFGDPLVDGPGGVAWEIPELTPTATPQELRIWRRNHAQRVEEFSRKEQGMNPER